jgi:TonB family protein
MTTLTADPVDRLQVGRRTVRRRPKPEPLEPRRPRRPPRDRMGPGLIASLLLHLALLALVILSTMTRKEQEAVSPSPSFEVVYQSGNPAPPSPPAPVQAETRPVAPPQAPPVPTAVQPPPPLPLPLPPPMPTPPRVVETAPPPPMPPLPRVEQALPLPPPPPPQPQREAQREVATNAAPAPARPAPPKPLQGMWLPNGLSLAPPSPSRPNQSRPHLDTNLDTVAMMGKYALEPLLAVRGAKVGPDWTNAFRRWLDENMRYPKSAIEAGHSGTNKVSLLVAPDGKVIGVKLLRQSGSVWLDAGITMPFNHATLPALPPPVDSAGAEVDLTVHWILIRQ